MKKRKLRKPRKLWDIAECFVADGHRFIKVRKTDHGWLLSGANDADKIAKWFAEAAAWVKEGDNVRQNKD